MFKNRYFVSVCIIVVLMLVLAAGYLWKNRTQEVINPDTSEEQKICYLTFDDGPSKNTGIILDILKEYDAKATFFVIGNELDEETGKILQRIAEEGHAIGLHANDHNYQKLYAGLDNFLKDYETLYERLRSDYGIETKLFRFPGGSACSCLNGQGKQYIRMMHQKGFYCFDWNVSGEDSVGKPTAASVEQHVFQDVFKYEHPIVLLHDSKIADATVEALPEILSRLTEEGYAMKTLKSDEEYIFPKNRE
ncbi:MAG: polysaccharide deacetylase family protein [Lachnospiraceae bacterium]